MNLDSNTTTPNFQHISVLLNECIDGLDIKEDGIYVDGTAGGGGHSLEIVKKLATGKLIAIDKDESAICAVSNRLAQFKNVQVVQGDFRDIPSVLKELAIEKVDGILLDLGVSSHQLDTPERGFSYHEDAPLDMRMSGKGLSAYDVVNTYEQEELIKIFRNYGEEKFSVGIAKGIIRTRNESPIETTSQLVDIIKLNIPAAARREGGHPAKRIFQAIRIEVNGELESLSACLNNSFELLSSGGRFAIITFHSLEDRIVKKAFAEFCKGCTCPPQFPICVCGKEPRAKLINRKPIMANENEIALNKRSRSAKLRVLQRI